MKHVIIGTAGHVDHGKSSLILALTQKDPDRLAEEKARGITIELGFSWLDLPDGSRSGIIDVPGHERFVSNMLAGAGGIDLALLVVAADEGVMPQTREHLGILSLLAIPRGVIAVSKCDLVEEDFIELVEEDIRDQVRGTFLEGAPMVRTSTATGQGIEALRQTLFEEISLLSQDRDHLPFRLPVDRVFSMGGFGTIVTGTVIEGQVSTGDQVQVFPGLKMARIRGIQIHETAADSASSGQRAALNLSGIHKDELSRGDSLAAPTSLIGTRLLDVRLTALADSPFPISHNMRVHLFQGSREVLARVVLLDRDILEPGETGLAQLRPEEEIFVKYGDRFVIRFYSPLETVGGGMVLDPLSSRRRRFRESNEEDFAVMASKDAADRLALAIALGSSSLDPLDKACYRAGVADRDSRALLDQLLKDGRVVALNDRTALSRASLDSLGVKASALLAAFHKRWPLERGMKREELRTRLMPRAPIQLSDLVIDRLLAGGILDSHEGLVSSRGYEISLSPAQAAALEELEKIYLTSAYTPPGPEDLELKGGKEIKTDQLLSLLINRGILVRLTPQILMHRDKVDEAWQMVQKKIEGEGSISLADFRDQLEATRKFAIALLEYFDRQKLTRLTGDVRVFYKQKDK